MAALFGSFILLALISCFADFAKSSGFYSINFFTKPETGSVSVTYEILVNGMTRGSGTPSVSESGTGWIDFEASLGDSIYVESTNINAENSFKLYYLIRNSSGNQIYDSRSNTFFPVNNCASASCTFFIAKSPGATTWTDSLATIYINNVASVFYDGISPAEVLFIVSSTDILRVEFSFGDGDNPLIGYALTTNPQEGPFNHWYYDSFGFNAIIPTGPGPNGGLLYPISAQLTSSLATSLNSGPSTSWIRQ